MNCIKKHFTVIKITTALFVFMVLAPVLYCLTTRTIEIEIETIKIHPTNNPRYDVYEVYTVSNGVLVADETPIPYIYDPNSYENSIHLLCIPQSPLRKIKYKIKVRGLDIPSLGLRRFIVAVEDVSFVPYYSSPCGTQLQYGNIKWK